MKRFLNPAFSISKQEKSSKHINNQNQESPDSIEVVKQEEKKKGQRIFKSHKPKSKCVPTPIRFKLSWAP